MKKTDSKNYRKFRIIAILLLALIVYSCCDDGFFTINSIRVYPCNDSSLVKTNILKDEICFITEMDITKHKGRQIIQSANATPPCRGYVNEVSLIKVEIYTNKEVYFQSNIPKEPKIVLAIRAGTNLSQDNKDLMSYITFENKYSRARTYYSWMGLPSMYFGEASIRSLIRFNDSPIRFKDGDYKFWFKFSFADGKVFEDSAEFSFTTKDNDLDIMTIKQENLKINDSTYSTIYESVNKIGERVQIIYNNYENGNPMSRYLYINGVQEGKYITYYRNYTLKEVGFYSKGKKSYPFYQYYPNGNIKYNITSTHGDLSVFFMNCEIKTNYDSTGHREKEEYYSNEPENKGQLVKRTIIKNYTPISEEIWDKKNQKRKDCRLLDDNKRFTKLWNKKGKLIEENTKFKYKKHYYLKKKLYDSDTFRIEFFNNSAGSTILDSLSNDEQKQLLEASKINF